MSICSPVLDARVLLIQREPVEFIMCFAEKKEKGKERNRSVGMRERERDRAAK